MRAGTTACAAVDTVASRRVGTISSDNRRAAADDRVVVGADAGLLHMAVPVFGGGEGDTAAKPAAAVAAAAFAAAAAVAATVAAAGAAAIDAASAAAGALLPEF